jgi:hypothetical protein
MTTTAAPGSRQAHREASERDKRARRFLLRLSLANWGIAVVAWTVSAFLGITSPASIIVYSVLFVIGLIAVVVALLTYVLEKFAHRPPDYEHTDLETGGDQGDAVTAAAADATAAPSVKTGEPEARTAAGPAAREAPAAARPSAAKPATADGKDAAAALDKGDTARSDAAKGDTAAKGDAPAAPAG